MGWPACDILNMESCEGRGVGRTLSRLITLTTQYKVILSPLINPPPLSIPLTLFGESFIRRYPIISGELSPSLFFSLSLFFSTPMYASPPLSPSLNESPSIHRALCTPFILMEEANINNWCSCPQREGLKGSKD